MQTEASASSEAVQDSAHESLPQAANITATQSASSSSQDAAVSTGEDARLPAPPADSSAAEATPSAAEATSPATEAASSAAEAASYAAEGTSPAAEGTSSAAGGTSSAEASTEVRNEADRSAAASQAVGQELPGESSSAFQEKGKVTGNRDSAAEDGLRLKSSSNRSVEPLHSVSGHLRSGNAPSRTQAPPLAMGLKGTTISGTLLSQASGGQAQPEAGQGGLAVKSAAGRYSISPNMDASGGNSFRGSSTMSTSVAPMAARSFAGEGTLGGAGSPPGKLGLNSANVKGSLWQQLLYEARSSKTPEKPKGYIIVLGGQDAGKSALLRQLQRLGSSKPLTPIETYTNTGGVSLVDYAYVGDRMLADPDDIHTVDAQDYIDVYILQNADMADHLARRLPPAAVTSICFLICLDVKQAWRAMDELERWKNVAERIANHLISQRDVDVQDALIERTQRYLANYRRGFLGTGLTRAATVMLELQQRGTSTSPMHKAEEVAKAEAASALQQQQQATEGESSSSGGGGRAAAAGGGSKGVLLLPVPAVVCLTRSDYFAALNSNPTRAGEADVIVAYIRRACLSFNAALIACSCKDPSEPKNVFLLYRYLLHRLYNYSFKEPPSLKDCETLFMPSGCDTFEAINEAVRRTIAGSFEKSYEEWITRSVEPLAEMGEAPGGRVAVQTSQEFLREMQVQHPSAVVATKTFKQQQLQQGTAAAAFDASSPSVDGVSRQESSRTRLLDSSSSMRPAIAVHSTASRFNSAVAAPPSASPCSFSASTALHQEPLTAAAASSGGGGLAAGGGRRAAAAEAGGGGPAVASMGGGLSTSGSSSGSKSFRTAAAESRSTRMHIAAASAKSKPRITVGGAIRSGPVASSSTSLSPSSSALGSGLRQPATGDSPSLQTFFQGLLAKSKAKAAPAARGRNRGARSKVPSPTAAGAAPSAKETFAAETQPPPADDV